MIFCLYYETLYNRFYFLNILSSSSLQFCLFSFVLLYNRLADTTQEVSRVRPPRFIRSDGIIRPYDKREADGHLILKVSVNLISLMSCFLNRTVRS